jgi:hypothetical protein
MRRQLGIAEESIYLHCNLLSAKCQKLSALRQQGVREIQRQNAFDRINDLIFHAF